MDVGCLSVTASRAAPPSARSSSVQRLTRAPFLSLPHHPASAKRSHPKQPAAAKYSSPAGAASSPRKCRHHRREVGTTPFRTSGSSSSSSSFHAAAAAAALPLGAIPTLSAYPCRATVAFPSSSITVIGSAFLQRELPASRQLSSNSQARGSGGRSAKSGPGPRGRPATVKVTSTIVAGLHYGDHNEEVGGEHGEGFTTWRPSGGPLHLDVEALNDRMRETGEWRLRFAHKPDEAFGVVYAWDGVLADTRPLRLAAWQRLAVEESLPWPSSHRPLDGLTPETIISQVFRWGRDWHQVRRLAMRASEIYSEEFRMRQCPAPGVEGWLSALRAANVPCAVTSPMSRMDVAAALERLGLAHYFRAVVAAEDGMESLAQRFLSAAVKVGRPPRKCVVFASSPRAVTAAHNCSMKVVAMVGVNSKHELRSADLAAHTCSELSVINVRRLFADAGHELMDLQTQKEAPSKAKRRLFTDVIY